MKRKTGAYRPIDGTWSNPAKVTNALAHAARVRGGSVPDGAGRDLNHMRGEPKEPSNPLIPVDAGCWKLRTPGTATAALVTIL